VIVRQAGSFGDKGYHVLTEAVHAHIQPETQDLFYLLPHQRVIHIQVRLFYGEGVHIVFAPHLIPLPDLSLEHAVPVVWQAAVGLGGTPDVIVGVGLCSAAAFLKPLMLVAGVINHQIHYHLHAPAVGSGKHFFEGRKSSVHGIDVRVV